ncbi:hypothetical protein BN1356_02421 [Streptococcus varani]|uniref:Uncharacterized protein n=1 Tax=Streptococcus varani TaxID=1608583 RepID=A0A0E3WFT2_9STRE|nr:hypothetical protein BN1356_02421 [Streptococcus varani]
MFIFILNKLANTMIVEEAKAFFFSVRRACRTSEAQVLRGHPLPVNPIATPKPDYREVAGRGRDSEIVALRTET